MRLKSVQVYHHIIHLVLLVCTCYAYSIYKSFSIPFVALLVNFVGFSGSPDKYRHQLHWVTLTICIWLLFEYDKYQTIPTTKTQHLTLKVLIWCVHFGLVVVYSITRRFKDLGGYGRSILILLMGGLALGIPTISFTDAVDRSDMLLQLSFMFVIWAIEFSIGYVYLKTEICKDIEYLVVMSTWVLVVNKWFAAVGTVFIITARLQSASSDTSMEWFKRGKTSTSQEVRDIEEQQTSDAIITTNGGVFTRWDEDKARITRYEKREEDELARRRTKGIKQKPKKNIKKTLKKKTPKPIEIHKYNTLPTTKSPQSPPQRKIKSFF